GGSEGGGGAGSFVTYSEKARRASLVNPLAASFIAPLLRRPSRKRKSWVTTKNDGCPPIDGVSGRTECPLGPWHPPHTCTRSSNVAPNPGLLSPMRRTAVRAASTAGGGWPAPGPNGRLNACN